MDFSTVKELYPNGIFTLEPLESNKYMVLFDGIQYLNIPKSDISNTEAILLNEIFKTPFPKSSWHQFLLQGIKNYDIGEGTAQLIHFTINNNSHIKYEWLNSFSNIFNSTLDSFFIYDNYGVVIVKRFEHSKNELQGILNMLDEDYSLSTTIYIGSLVDKSLLHNIYLEERNIFLENTHNRKINDFSTCYSSYYLMDSLTNSVICTNIKNIITNQKDIPELIVSLWKNQGNLSAVAKETFAHRNTINYRIERLNEDYSIDLKDMNQLFLCYLLLH